MDRALVIRWLGVATLAKAGSQLFSWVTTIVVMRTLDPADYGVVSVVVAFSALLALFGDYPLLTQLVRAKQPSMRRARAYFGFSILAAAAGIVLLLVAAPLFAAAYESAHVREAMWLQALGLALLPLKLVPESTLLREMRFRQHTSCVLADATVAAVATLLMAMSGLGFRALILGPIVGFGARLVLLYYFTGASIRPQFERRLIWKVARASVQLIAAELLMHLNASVPIFIVAAYLSTAEVGYFSTALYWAMVPVARTMVILNQVMLPVFSTMASGGQAFCHAIRRALNNLAYITVPLFFGLSVCADDIVSLMLGSKWAPVGYGLALIALVMPLRMLRDFLINPLQSQREDGTVMRLQFLQTIGTSAACLVGSAFGYRSLIVATSLSYLLIASLSIATALKRLQVALRPIALDLARVWLAGGLMYMAVLASHQLSPQELSVSARLGVQIAVGVVSYVLLTPMLMQVASADITDAMRSMFKRWQRGAS